MDKFDRAFLHIIAVEGTAYTNDPSDRGGETRYGISRSTYERYTGKRANQGEIRLMSLSYAKEIYRVLFWAYIKGDQLPDKIGLALFDQAVNRGVPAAIRLLQAAMGIKADGILGPKTIAKIKEENEVVLLYKFCRECQLSYVRIVQANPSQIRFLAGWSNRLWELMSVAS